MWVELASAGLNVVCAVASLVLVAVLCGVGGWLA